jgi:RNA polymerase sigma factor (sigma-70 family)
MQLEEILQDYKAWLHKVAMDLTADIDHQKDVIQVGRIAMWRALERYDASKGALPSFLTSAARYAMIEEAYGRGKGRDRDRTKQLKLSPVAPDSPFWEMSVAGLLSEMEMAYHRGEVAKAINQLSPEQREYVYRRFWKDEPEPEIREALGRQSPVHYLWTDKRSGARKQLAESLSHLKEIV